MPSALPIPPPGFDELSAEEKVEYVSSLWHRIGAHPEKASALLGSVTLYIDTFAPEPYVLKKAIPVSIQQRPDGFLASFADANVNTSGDTQHEAFANLKELILDVYDSLTTLPLSKLGPGPRRQLTVLQEFVQRADAHEGTR